MSAALRPARSVTRPDSSVGDIGTRPTSLKLDRNATRLIALRLRILDHQPEIARVLADPRAVADTLVRRAESDFGEVAIGPISSGSVYGRLRVGIHREGVSGCIDGCHLVRERPLEIAREWSRVVAFETKEDVDRSHVGPCAFASAHDLE